MTTRKTLAIINPVSGTGKQKNAETLLRTHLDKGLFDLAIIYTEYAGHGTEIAKDAIKSDIDTIIAIGGDGTINEIGKVLINSEISLGIIPCGSGNGLARHLGIPMNIVKAIKHLNNTISRAIDVVSINEEYSLNVSGIGFDAHVSHQFAKMKTRGLKSYLKAVMQSFFSFQNIDCEIKVGKLNIIINAFMVSIANSTQFGNDAYIAPKASLTDGKFNIVIIKKPKFYQLFGLMFFAAIRKIHKSKLVTTFEASDIIIKHSQKEAHLDGEPTMISSPTEIKIIPSALKVLVKENKEI